MKRISLVADWMGDERLKEKVIRWFDMVTFNSSFFKAEAIFNN